MAIAMAIILMVIWYYAALGYAMRGTYNYFSAPITSQFAVMPLWALITLFKLGGVSTHNAWLVGFYPILLIPFILLKLMKFVFFLIAMATLIIAIILEAMLASIDRKSFYVSIIWALRRNDSAVVSAEEYKSLEAKLKHANGQLKQNHKYTMRLENKGKAKDELIKVAIANNLPHKQILAIMNDVNTK
jgi:sensor histidine kinase YesM